MDCSRSSSRWAPPLWQEVCNVPKISQRRAHIAIAGAGFTGLVCALHLLNAGYQVTLLEAIKLYISAASPATADFKSFRWDRFYHCILTSDLCSESRLLEQIQLKDQLRWTATEVGFFSHGELHTMTKPADLLRFPHLSLWDKLRMAAGTIYAARLCGGTGLENISLGIRGRSAFLESAYFRRYGNLFSAASSERRATMPPRPSCVGHPAASSAPRGRRVHRSRKKLPVCSRRIRNRILSDWPQWSRKAEAQIRTNVQALNKYHAS